MLTQMQKDLLEQAYAEEPSLLLVILKVALMMGDADTVLHITNNFANCYDEEVQAEFTMIKEAVEAVVAMTADMPEGATVH